MKLTPHATLTHYSEEFLLLAISQQKIKGSFKKTRSKEDPIFQKELKK